MQRSRAQCQRILFRFGLLLALSYGFLYFSYKYYTPEFGGSDFFVYYQMYLHPLDFEAAGSPWIYRQLTALVVHLVWKFGVFYDTSISFSQEGDEKRVFFAALFTNYLALTISALVVTFSAEKICGQKNEAWPLLAGMLCYFSALMQQAVLTGLTEGISWLLVALGFLGYITRSVTLVGVVLGFCIIQRELVAAVFGALSAVSLAYDTKDRNFHAVVLLLSIASSLGYLLLRSWLIPVAGHEEQLDPFVLLSALEAWQSKITRNFILQAFLSQNLLMLSAASSAVLLFLRSIGRKMELQVFPSADLSVFIAALVLTMIGFAVSLDPANVNNVGRYLSMLTPIAVPLLVRNMAYLVALPVR